MITESYKSHGNALIYLIFHLGNSITALTGGTAPSPDPKPNPLPEPASDPQPQPSPQPSNDPEPESSSTPETEMKTGYADCLGDGTCIMAAYSDLDKGTA